MKKYQIQNTKYKIPRRRVAVAMSGGVDSSTVAGMLSEQGYDCIGVFMRLGIERGCCDEAAARRVCNKLGIKFYPLDVRAKFKKEVKDYFLKAYEKGITPNPCVACNKFIKFGELLKKAESLGCDYLATGHYIKLKKIGKTFKLYKAKDASKDQSYFLYNLTQKDLAKILFPLGDSFKEKLKKKATKDALPYLKEESQDICFLAGEHNEFLKRNIKLKKGPIKDLEGETIGEHQGLPLYTIGQRKGVELGGKGPYYVVRGDSKTNTLYVTNKKDDESLYGKSLEVEKVNWLSGLSPKLPYKCLAVIRYRHKPVACIIKAAKNGELALEFAEAQRAITRGQSVVFYKGDELLGGGVIK
jgi:tRNA-uridine 2-sulfurtransferase